MNQTQFENALDMDLVKVDPNWALRIPTNLATRRKLLPFTIVDGMVQVACQNPDDVQGLQAVERYVESPVVANLAEPDSLERAIKRIFQGPTYWTRNAGAPIRSGIGPMTAGAEPDAEDVVALGDELFHAARIRNATDIHIDPTSGETRIRLRVDGVLEDYRQLPQAIHGALISRLKILGGMDIAERRAPQDGRFTLQGDDDHEIDIRTATLPTKHGERMTLRLLATQTGRLTLEKLGMDPAAAVAFEESIAKPHGLILLTGPTGCGKSTTLYAALRHLISRRSLNIVTIEDPVEYVIDGIAQVEVDSADKVSFNRALRSVLRHDPDVLMIGEIRDEETASVALKAALTGHLVFSTLHTNSAINSITRLIDMGIQPYLVGATIRLVVAQRLVRRICSQCRFATELTKEQAGWLGQPEAAGMTVFESTGCKYCAGRGFVGRVGIFEMIQSDQELARLISTKADESVLMEYVRSNGVVRLTDDALEKLKRGETTVREVATVVTHW